MLGTIPGAVRPSAVVPDMTAAPQFHPSRSTQPISGSCAIQEPIPTTRQRRPTEMFRKARTTTGSNCAPEHLTSSCAGGGDADRLAIRPHRGHHLIRVGHRDDAPRERDLIAGQPARVAATVEALVVMGDCVGPLAQPRGKRTDDPGALVGVTTDVVHLRAGELRGLREDLGRDHQLADVVEQRRPAQPGAIAGSELHLVGDEVGEHANTFRVTAGLAVVDAERRDELEHQSACARPRRRSPPCRALPGAAAADRAVCRPDEPQRTASARGRGRASTD